MSVARWPTHPSGASRGSGLPLLLGVVGITLGSLALVLLLGCQTSVGVSPLEQEAQAIDRSLICPVCPGETLDQSQAELARQMRAIVREKLQEGLTTGQVLQFFVDRYGPGVLAAPPKKGFHVLAWILPPVGLLLGVGILVLAVRSMRRRGLAVLPPESAPTEAALSPYLSRVDEEIRRAGLSAGRPENPSDRGSS